MRQSRVVKREPLDSTAPLQSSSGHDSPNSLQVRTQWRQIDATDEAIYHHRLLSVTPPKIERHASEPAPSLKVSSPHLLTVPSSPTMGGGMPFLVKQHSHPLLPSQQSMSMGGSMDMPSPPSSAYTLHRQMSQPDPILLPMVSSGGSSSGGIPVSSSLSQLVATTLKCDDSESGLMMLSKNNSPTIVVVTDSGSPLTPASDCPIRVKTEELQRSASTPHTLTRELSFESRSQHCPVIRPGPALGCNFCWNTIDNHGRILRRKTKYHCPECQTNLCIVPCFQQYHERKTTEEASQSSSMQPNNNETSSKPSFGSSGAPSLRHHHKTGSL